MNIRILALFLSLVLACGAAEAPAPAVKARTIRGDPRLPAGELEAAFTAEQWKALADMPYRAVVILNTQINTNNNMVTAGTVRLSEPDATWVEPARLLAKTIRLKAASIGTNISPTAEVFVIFYGTGEGRRAFIYARQTGDTTVGGWSSGGSREVNHGSPKYFGIEKF